MLWRGFELMADLKWGRGERINYTNEHKKITQITFNYLKSDDYFSIISGILIVLAFVW